MRKPSRSFRLAVFLPAALLLDLGVKASAQQAHADHANMNMPAQTVAASARQTRWSDPASWPEGKVPRAGDASTLNGRNNGAARIP